MPTTTELSEDLRAMSSKLEDYLLDDELYKTITVPTARGDRLIKMTLGGMLERIRDLRDQAPNDPAIQKAEEALAYMRANRPEPYYQRLAREAKSYAGSWNWFLQDCWDNTASCADNYASEVPLRQRIELLLREGGTRPEMSNVRQQVDALDQRLRKIWVPRDQAVVKGGDKYDKAQYWWLYGEPRPKRP